MAADEPPALRAATLADEVFLRSMYRGLRAEELAGIGWNAEQAASFADLQFTAQTAAYRAAFPHAEHFVVEHRAIAVGRVITDRSTDRLELVDLALVASVRGQGIGSALVERLQRDAAGMGVPLRLHVDKSSRAVSFYRRHGFVVTADDDMRYAMQWFSATA